MATYLDGVLLHWERMCTYGANSPLWSETGNPSCKNNDDRPVVFPTLDTGTAFSYWGSRDTRFCFTGQQACLRLYKNYAATGAEILEIYSSGSCTALTPLASL
eukprot:740761-Rhodomonas_salina.1